MKSQIFNISLLLVAFALIITGFKKAKSKGFYRHIRIIDFLFAGFSFGAFILDVLKFLDYNMFNNIVTLFLVVAGAYFTYRVYKDVNQLQITIYGVESGYLKDIVLQLLKKYCVSFSMDRFLSENIIEITDDNAIINFDEHENEISGITLKFKRYKNIPHIYQILDDLEKDITENSHMSPLTGLGGIMGGIGFLLLYYVIRMYSGGL